MTPDQLVVALLEPPAVPYVDIAPADRPSPRAGDGQARVADLAPDGRVRVLRDREVAAGRAARRLPWLAAALKDAPKGASLEGFLWPATYRVLPGHDAGGAHPADARQVRVERRTRPDGGRQGSRAELLPGHHHGLDRREGGPAGRGEGAHRGGLQQPARPEEVADRPAPVGPDDLLHPRHARAGQAQGPRLDQVRLLGADQGRPDGRRAAAGSGRLQHVHERGPATRADLARRR